MNTYLPLEPQETPDPYADWKPESRAYQRYGAQALEVISALEVRVGGPLTVIRLQTLAALAGVTPPPGGYTYEAAAIRKLKNAPGRGCPPHIRDGLMIQLDRLRDIARPASTSTGSAA